MAQMAKAQVWYARRLGMSLSMKWGEGRGDCQIVFTLHTHIFKYFFHTFYIILFFLIISDRKNFSIVRSLCNILKYSLAHISTMKNYFRIFCLFIDLLFLECHPCQLFQLVLFLKFLKRFYALSTIHKFFHPFSFKNSNSKYMNK